MSPKYAPMPVLTAAEVAKRADRPMRELLRHPDFPDPMRIHGKRRWRVEEVDAWLARQP